MSAPDAGNLTRLRRERAKRIVVILWPDMEPEDIDIWLDAEQGALEVRCADVFRLAQELQ